MKDGRRLKVVVGVQLRDNIRFWDSDFKGRLKAPAIMVSFGEIYRRGIVFEESLAVGLNEYLNFRGEIFLDNGSFAFLNGGKRPPIADYVRYLRGAAPDWASVPADYIPLPSTEPRVARRLGRRTAAINARYGPLGFTPIVHVGSDFRSRLRAVVGALDPHYIGIGGVVPHIRHAKGADPRATVSALAWAREEAANSVLHVFGLGGGITSLHVAAALGMDSVDSTGWASRAGRGLVVLPGRGQRAVVRGKTSWSATPLSAADRSMLRQCRCPACETAPLLALRYPGRRGFRNRAIHNLWTTLEEARLVNEHISNGDFAEWSRLRLARNRSWYLVHHALEATRRRLRGSLASSL